VDAPDVCQTPRWELYKRSLKNLSIDDFIKSATTLPSAVILDVRTLEEYKSGHLADAMHIDYLSQDLSDQIEKLDSTKDYFIYCRTGRRSLRMCMILRNAGLEVTNLEGGIVDIDGGLLRQN